MKTIVVGTVDYQELFKPFGEVTHYKPELLNRLGEWDCIVFTGGSDVSPDRYDQVHHPKTFSHPERDVLEFDLFEMAKKRGMRMVGICRGAQLMCVANGDRLIQHVNGHNNKTHNIVTNTDQVVEVDGDHHQMMYPESAEIVAWSIDIATTYESGMRQQDPFIEGGRIIEPEVVYYPKTNGLCVQFHPEWSSKDSDARAYFNQLIEDYLL